MRVVFAPEPPSSPDFQVGAKLRLRAVFLDDDLGTPLDPTTVTLTLTPPFTASLTPAMTKDNVGVYRYDATLNTIGRWRFTVQGAGPSGDAGKGTFEAFVFNVD